MPLWDEIKKPFTDEAGKRIVAVIFAVLALGLGWVWGHASNNAKANLLKLLEESLVIDDTDYDSAGKERDANYARQIREFRKTMINFVQQLIEPDPDYTSADRVKRRDPASTSAIRGFQQAEMKQLTGLISQKPEYFDQANKLPRHPAVVPFVKNFLKALNAVMETDVKNINGGVHWIRADRYICSRSHIHQCIITKKRNYKPKSTQF